MMTGFAEILRTIIENSLGQLQNVGKSKMESKPSADKWSKKEILGHLIDSAFNNHPRFLTGQYQDNLIFQGYDQVHWVKLSNYQEREIKDLIEIWKVINLNLCRLIENIDPGVLERKTLHHNFDLICMVPVDKGEESSLGYLISDYIYHLEHHLSQMIPGYKKTHKHPKK